jgi:phospholipase/carboxylesterase
MARRLVTTTLGPLRARVVDDDARSGPPSLVAIFCHGFGAPGDDLVSLAPEIASLSTTVAERVRFVFPEAPLALDNVPFGGRAWWPIDMMALQMAMARGLRRQLADESPEGLPSARQKLLGLVDVVLQQTGLTMDRVFLAGFSQGAMLATDTTLRLDEAPAGLGVLSGTLLNQGEWRRLAPRRAGLSVIQSHGDSDPILPFDGALALKGVLEEAGLSVDFHAFSGGHGIDGDVLEAIARFLAARVA